MPTLLPGGFVFQSGKDGNGYLLNGASLGGVSSPLATVSGLCLGGSFGGSVYDFGDSTIYVACGGRMRALSLGPGSPPSLTTKPGFSAPAGTSGPPTIAGGLVWATNSNGRLYSLDLGSGAASSQFAIPEAGSEVNHFASPSAGDGRLFVGSGDQVTAFTIALPPPPGSPPAGSQAGTTAASGASNAGPTISRVSLSPRRFRATRAVPLRLTLSEPATLTVAATQLHHGHFVRRRCSLKARRGKPCQVRPIFARLRFKAAPGPNALKLRLRRLRPGHYTAFIYATDGSGRRSSTIQIRFTILPAQSSSTRKSSLRPAGASLMALATSVGLGASHQPS
jgi:hypothetical protein